MCAAPLFGVLFLGQSYPITSTAFTQVDPTHWVLDVCASVTPAFGDLKEVVLFLLAPGTLDPSTALGLYVRAGSADWLYRGCVHHGHPSESMPLQWPNTAELKSAGPLLAGPGAVQIGVSIEPGVEIINKEGSKLGAREEYAKRVAMDLFRYFESFQNAKQYGDMIVVPAQALDKWFSRFSERFRRDPDYLTRPSEQF